MQITIIGTGYVGLVSGACLAELGHHVICVDKDEAKINALTGGTIPIFEPGLEQLVKDNTEKENLSFTSSLQQSLDAAEVVFIAVGTPPDGNDGGADLSHVFAVAEELAPLLNDGMLVVTKSTVPVGTGAQVKTKIAEIRPDLTFDVASNPEFLREGNAVNDFLKPDRVVVGTESDVAWKKMAEIYRPLSDKGVPVLFTNIKTAELTKYAANAFLATKISFINEIADICERVGGDIEDVVKGLALDHRIGGGHLRPGPGFGGSCFPKDTLALRKTARDAGVPANIVETVIDGNDQRKLRMADKIIAACGGSVSGKAIAILGLAFKANTDDMRDSPALAIVPKLLEHSANIRAYDPEAMDQAKTMLSGDISWCNDSYEALQGADAAVIITEWDEFANLDLDKVKSTLASPIIIDLRNLYSPTEMSAKGFQYTSIGRSAE